MTFPPRRFSLDKPVFTHKYLIRESHMGVHSMVALVQTVAYLGLEARGRGAVPIGPGLPGFTVVGLPDKAVNESRQRVQAALTAMGLALPPKRITINMSPADLPKEGSHYDLPIALALLAAMGVTDGEQLGDFLAVGELSLDGRIAASPGVLLAALHASERELGLICPAAQGAEASWAAGVPVIAPPDLASLLAHLKARRPFRPRPGHSTPSVPGPDLRQVKGQETARRALEIGRGRTQSADGRAARSGQIADGGLFARHPARPDPGRGAGGFDDRLGRRNVGRRAHQPRPPFPQPAPFRQHGRHDRRRIARASGRGLDGASGRPVP
jgi:magnesium chelatase family protein